MQINNTNEGSAACSAKKQIWPTVDVSVKFVYCFIWLLLYKN